MMLPLRSLALLGLSVLLLSGCVIDRTRISGSFLMKSRVETLRERSRALEDDLTKERERVDQIEERSASARRRSVSSFTSCALARPVTADASR